MFLWTCTQFWLLLPIYARYCLPLTCRSRNCEFAPMFQTMSFSLELGGSESNALVVWKCSVLVITIFFQFDFLLWTLMEERETETILSIIVLTLLLASAKDTKLHIPCCNSLYVDSHWPPISMSFFCTGRHRKGRLWSGFTIGTETPTKPSCSTRCCACL